MEAPSSGNLTANTENVPPDQSFAVLYVQVVLLCGIIIVALVGNSLVLFVIAKHLRWKSFTNVLTGSLAASDLLAACVCMPFTLVSLGVAISNSKYEVFTNIVCLLNATLNTTMSAASTFMLAFIAIDRYYVMGNTVPRLGPGGRFALFAVLGSWTAALLAAMPYYAAVSPSRRYQKPGYHHCMYVFHIRSSNEGLWYSLLLILLCYILPVITMIFCCVHLWTVVRQTDHRILPASAQATHVRFSAELRTAKTLIVLVILYVFTKGPYVLIGVMCAIVGVPVNYALDSLGLWLFWSSCATSPIVYAIRNPSFGEMLRLRPPHPSRSFTNLAIVEHSVNKSRSAHEGAAGTWPGLQETPADSPCSGEDWTASRPREDSLFSVITNSTITSSGSASALVTTRQPPLSARRAHSTPGTDGSRQHYPMPGIARSTSQ